MRGERTTIIFGIYVGFRGVYIYIYIQLFNLGQFCFWKLHQFRSQQKLGLFPAFVTGPWNINMLNQKINQLKRKIIRTKPSFFGFSKAIHFQG